MAQKAQGQSGRTKAERRKPRPGILDDVLSDYATREELALGFGYSERTVAGWKQDDEGPVSLPVGELVLYHKDDIRAWLKKKHDRARAAARRSAS